ncbi:MAG: peptidase M13, partial [Actinobacteria bacterium]|nr:peptidase M13 [Actinomycetota bacterium]
MTILDDARAGMDPDIRPQDDLFRHVNGRWLETTEIPSDRSAWGSFVALAEQSEQRVRQIITDLSAGRHEPGSNAQKIGDLFTSFMDEERIDALGAEPVAADLAEVASLTDLDSLVAFVGGLERRGGGGFFGAYVNTDDRDADRYLVNIVQGGIGLPDESYYREDKFAEIRTAYLAHLEKLLGLAGWPDPARAAQQVLDVETRLAQGHWERAETRDVLKAYNLTSLDELRALAPALPLDTWAAGLGAEEQTLAETIVRQPSYLRHLSSALEEVPLEDWKAWLAIRVVRAAAPYLSSPFVEENFEFYGRTLQGTPELRVRWKRGVSFVEGSVGEAVGAEYVARHFPPRAKELMVELVANLLEAYRRNIEALDWMTEETKQRAYRKLETFRPKIGYPDKWRDYSALEVGPDDLLGNVRAAAAFETDRELGKIGGPVDRDEWFMLPQQVNAYYNPGMNEI